MSEDTFRRRYRHLIVDVSPRRQAVRLSDALAIGESNKERDFFGCVRPHGGSSGAVQVRLSGGP
jgi:hypothetical protein